MYNLTVKLPMDQALTFTKKNIGAAEVAKIKEMSKSRTVYDMVTCVLYPIKTDTFRHFARDLFLPSFINVAMKTEGVFLKVLAFVWDIFSLCTRLFTAIPRAAYNHWRGEHALRTWLKKEGAPAALAASKLVTVILKPHFSQEPQQIPDGQVGIECKYTLYRTLYLEDTFAELDQMVIAPDTRWNHTPIFRTQDREESLCATS